MCFTENCLVKHWLDLLDGSNFYSDFAYIVPLGVPATPFNFRSLLGKLSLDPTLNLGTHLKFEFLSASSPLC